MRYVALLRGINVGGNTMIKMADLKQTFEALGFERVATYINSGNIAFDVSKGSLKTEAALIQQIEAGIERGFGKPISVMLRSQEAISEIMGRNPFEGQFESHKEMHVLFMNENMPPEKIIQLESQSNETDKFIVSGREIFCHLKLGIADSLLGKGFIDRKLKVSVTGRNWRTVEKLAEL